MLRLLRRASHRRPTRACGPVRAQCTAWWSAARRPCCRRRMRPTCGAGWRRGARGGLAASGGTAPTRRARARARPASAGTRSTCARSPARPCTAGSSLEAPWLSHCQAGLCRPETARAQKPTALYGAGGPQAVGAMGGLLRSVSSGFSAQLRSPHKRAAGRRPPAPALPEEPPACAYMPLFMWVGACERQLSLGGSGGAHSVCVKGCHGLRLRGSCPAAQHAHASHA